MKHIWLYAVVASTAFAASGCASNDEAYVADLRAAVSQADSTLVDAITESEATGAKSIAGELSVKGQMYSVRAVQAADLLRFRYRLGGERISEDSIGSSPEGDCSHAISATEAIAIAEANQGGTATSLELEMEDDDDDVPCTWEVQVLTPSELMEVEVGPSGDVLETEVSDEDGSGDDDD
jgi:uncharacterized membrane protein YkoI